MEDKKEMPRALGILMAAMTRADKRLLQIEHANAEALLECMADTDRETALQAYHDYKNVFSFGGADHDFSSMLCKLSPLQKVETLRALKLLAMCDGEIHDSEQALILRLTKQMMANSPERVESTKANLQRGI